MKSSVAKHYGCQRARNCGQIANGRSKANRSSVRNLKCCFARHAANIAPRMQRGTINVSFGGRSLWQESQRAHLAHDVDGTHEQLVEMAVLHQLRQMYKRVLKARPHSGEANSHMPSAIEQSNSSFGKSINQSIDLSINQPSTNWRRPLSSKIQLTYLLWNYYCECLNIFGLKKHRRNTEPVSARSGSILHPKTWLMALHSTYFPLRSSLISSLKHRSLKRTPARWYTWQWNSQWNSQ